MKPRLVVFTLLLSVIATERAPSETPGTHGQVEPASQDTDSRRLPSPPGADDATHAPWGYLLELRTQKLHELRQPEFRLGRRRSSDLTFSSERVSRRHATIRWSGTTATLEDLGSTNGTFLNGSAVAAGRPMELKPGDLLALADVQLLFHSERTTLWQDELKLQLENRFIELKLNIPKDPKTKRGAANTDSSVSEYEMFDPIASTATISTMTGDVELEVAPDVDLLHGFTPNQAAYVGHAKIIDEGIELSLWAAENRESIVSRRAAFDHLKHTTLKIQWGRPIAQNQPAYRRDILVTVFEPYPRDTRSARASARLARSLVRHKHPTAIRDVASSLTTRRRLDRSDSDALALAIEAQRLWKASGLTQGNRTAESPDGDRDHVAAELARMHARLANARAPDSDAMGIKGTNGTTGEVGDSANPPASTVGRDINTRFRVSVDTVNLPVTVFDGDDRLVAGLSKDNFRVYEDGAPQEVKFFSHGEAPLRLVILLDTSSSMRIKIDLARKAAVQFVRSLKPGDQIRVVEFNDRVLTLVDFTSDFDQVEQALLQTKPKGATSLYTALYASLKDLARIPATDNERKGLILLSDGSDTRSLVNFDDVREVARKSNVLIYAISLRATAKDLQKEKYYKAKYELDMLAKESGGRSLAPEQLKDLAGMYQLIATELKSQYLIGYTSSKSRNDGTWRRLEVLSEAPKTAVRTRTGYYAPRPVKRRKR